MRNLAVAANERAHQVDGERALPLEADGVQDCLPR